LHWRVKIWDLLVPTAVSCETQSRWVDELCMCSWCDGALLVTPSVIYLEFKADLTSMATTAFCSDIPSHLVCA
jgi:hypothetical protein